MVFKAPREIKVKEDWVLRVYRVLMEYKAPREIKVMSATKGLKALRD